MLATPTTTDEPNELATERQETELATDSLPEECECCIDRISDFNEDSSQHNAVEGVKFAICWFFICLISFFPPPKRYFKGQIVSSRE